MDAAVTSKINLVSAEMAERASAMIPFLRERAKATETMRRPPEETRRRLKSEGFARIYQPRRFGGAEGRMVDGVDTLRALGRGCGATAWITVQNVLHNFMLANWPTQAQHEVWGATPDALVSGILIPGLGKATKVNGGHRLTGQWPFVSGIDIADWAIFTAECRDSDEDKGQERHFVVRKDQVTVLDTWHAIGLKGSSSHDVVVSDLFVPDHMSVTMDELKGDGRSPGSKVNTASLYRIPAYAVAGALIGSAQLGVAEAAVDYYIDSARKRVATMSGKSVAAFTTQQVKVAEAKAGVLAARELLYSVANDAERVVENGGATTVEDRTRYRAMATYAGRLSSSAVNLVLEAGGGGVVYERNPIARCVSDMTVANRHITQNWDVNASTYGRVLLGLPCGVAALED